MKPRSKKETVMDQHEPSRLSFSLPQVFLAPRPPSVGFRYGRGRTGGTTNLDLVIQLAMAAGRPVLEGDPRGVGQPPEPGELISRRTGRDPGR